MKYPTLPGFLLDIPGYEEITQNDIYCPECWEYNKKRIMFFDSEDNLYKCRNLKLTLEQTKEFKDYYSVIPFPHDEFTNEPIRLTDKQRKEIVKQFNDQRRNNRKINLL